MNSVELTLFASRVAAVCEEMGAVLQRAAFSPNIRDRLDYSCALFSADGGLLAQAAHIPVHLGSMAYAMAGLVQQRSWQPMEMVVVNDPFLGGTHLPDVTLIAPLFMDDRLLAFVVNRAHHAHIGAAAPGSMPLSRSLADEGVVIPPTLVATADGLLHEVVNHLVDAVGSDDFAGDFAAQRSANLAGLARLQPLLRSMGEAAFAAAVTALNSYSETIARRALGVIPPGRYGGEDFLDDDGAGTSPLAIRVTLEVAADGGVTVDFAGTARQCAGNVNCPLAVTAAAVYYLLRTLMPETIPVCAGTFAAITLQATLGSLVNANPGAAVVAGNVETSSRIVDALMAALAPVLPQLIPAASHGSMNNVAMGGRELGRFWDYYETIGGGMGAGSEGGGLSGVQTHMTNTLNTPIEVVESRFPLRIRRYALRRGSGGAGQRRGGDGMVREYEFLSPASVTLISERRQLAPWGLAGGAAALVGENRLNGELLPAKVALQVQAGDRLTVATAGGGGWGHSH
ncbi:MAG: hydantoinase B/oxoprolinase family protein [Gammaproteobacteria bacterium]|nr:hydantoinase B/oxoprolinase family protein [Gammaproteobacteria bacterium]